MQVYVHVLTCAQFIMSSDIIPPSSIAHDVNFGIDSIIPSSTSDDSSRTILSSTPQASSIKHPRQLLQRDTAKSQPKEPHEHDEDMHSDSKNSPETRSVSLRGGMFIYPTTFKAGSYAETFKAGSYTQMIGRERKDRNEVVRSGPSLAEKKSQNSDSPPFRG